MKEELVLQHRCFAPPRSLFDHAASSRSLVHPRPTHPPHLPLAHQTPAQVTAYTVTDTAETLLSSFSHLQPAVKALSAHLRRKQHHLDIGPPVFAAMDGVLIGERKALAASKASRQQ